MDVLAWMVAAVVPVAVIGATVLLIIHSLVSASREQQRRLEYYRTNELLPGPSLGLAHQPMASFEDGPFLKSYGDQPFIDEVSEERTMVRAGRPVHTFVETCRTMDDSPNIQFFCVAAQTRWAGEGHVLRQRLQGVIPPPLANEARSWCQRGEARAVMVYRGLVVIRAERFDLVPLNADRALWLAGQLDAWATGPHLR